MHRSIALLVALLLGAPAAAAAAAAAATHHSPATLTRSARVAFENCSRATLTVKMSRLSFNAYEAVSFRVTIHNDTGTTCGATVRPFPTPQPDAMTVGPCGPIGMEFENSAHIDVFPGRVAYSCPMEVGPILRGHASLTTTASWDQRTHFYDAAEVPRGRYRLFVGDPISGGTGALSFPLTLTQG